MRIDPCPAGAPYTVKRSLASVPSLCCDTDRLQDARRARLACSVLPALHQAEGLAGAAEHRGNVALAHAGRFTRGSNPLRADRRESDLLGSYGRAPHHAALPGARVSPASSAS